MTTYQDSYGGTRRAPPVRAALRAAELARDDLIARWPKLCQNCYGTDADDEGGVCGECDAGRIRLERDEAKTFLELSRTDVRNRNDTIDRLSAQGETEMSDTPKVVDRNAQRMVGPAFEAGWRAAAEWSGRDDLLADIGSPAYRKDRQKFIRAALQQARKERK